LTVFTIVPVLGSYLSFKRVLPQTAVGEKATRARRHFGNGSKAEVATLDSIRPL